VDDGLVRLPVELDDALREQVRELAHTLGWPPDDAVLILLGYGAAVHIDAARDDPVHALGTARAELALLRYRVYSASEAVRDLQLNVTGLRASIAQAEKSLVTLEQTVADLRNRAPQVDVSHEPASSPQSPSTPQETLFSFFARSRSHREGKER